MNITFQQVGRLLDRALVAEASKVVKTRGHNGAGDDFGSKFVNACAADYVLSCAEREVTANPANVNAARLASFLRNSLS